MKPFKLGVKSWRKAQVTARLDERSYTVETDDGAVYRRNQQHLRKTPQPPVGPIITAPELDMASADEKGTTTAASTPDQSNAPLEPHPEVVTVPDNVGGQSESGRAQHSSRTISVTILMTRNLFSCSYHSV